MRCPVCFSRDIDVLMKLDKSNHYSCLKCSYKGNIEEVRQAYKDIQKKYKFIDKRITIEDYHQL
jgi:Zn ribbon nucleic-acid-binding protein